MTDVVEDGSEAAPVIDPRRVRGAFITVLVGMGVVTLDMTMVATAAPKLAVALGDFSNVAWVVTAVALGQVISIPIVGRLADIRGRRTVFQAAMVLFIAGSVASGLSQGFEQLIAARIVQGLGAGSLMTLAQILLGDFVSPRQRGRYLSYLGVMFAIANMCGPIIGGVIVDHASWRLIFFVNVPLGAVALWVSARHLPGGRPDPDGDVGFLSASLLGLAVTGLYLVVSWGGDTFEWRSLPVLIAAAAAIGLFGVFVVAQRQSSSPIFPRILLRDTTFKVSVALGFANGVAMHTCVFFVPVFLQAVAGLDATASGARLMVLMGSIIVSMVVTARVITRYGRYKAIATAGATATATGLALMAASGPGTSPNAYTAYFVLAGIGIGTVVQLPTWLVQNAVPVSVMGPGTAGALFFRQLGATSGVAAAGALFAGGITSGLATAGASAAAVDVDDILGEPSRVALLPVEAVDLLREIVASGVSDVFLFLALPAMIVSIVLTFVLPAVPLRESVESVVYS